MAIEKINTANLEIYENVGLAFQDLMNGQINADVWTTGLRSDMSPKIRIG